MTHVHTQLLAASAGNVEGIVVDLRSVEYMDSAAVSMLFDLVRQVVDRRRAVALFVDETSPLTRLLTITDLTSLVPICTTEDECVDFLQGREL